jgi:hypothetical protein
MKRALFIMYILLLTVSFTPKAEARTLTSAERASLMQQINFLLEQIKELQQLLNQKQSNTFSSQILPSSAVVEARYQIYGDGHAVVLADNEEKQMVNRFLELSPDNLDKKFDEALFFSEKNISLDAFVETLDSTDSWRVGFNTDLFDYAIDDEVTAELFIHEIGHVVAFEEFGNKTLLQAFEDTFWTDRKAREVFVSDYASESPSEDFAESFLFFVTSVNYQGVASEKVKWFNRYPKLQEYRREINSNL